MDQKRVSEIHEVTASSASVGQSGSTGVEVRPFQDVEQAGDGVLPEGVLRPVMRAELRALVGELKRHSFRNKTLGLFTLFGYPVVVAMPAINLVAPYLKAAFHENVFFGIAMFALILFLVMSVWVMLMKYVTVTYPDSKPCTRIHDSVIRLAAMGELASIGPLCHALHVNNPNPRIAMNALTKLLPQLHDADSISLDSRELRGLCMILSEEDTDGEDASRFSKGYPLDWVAARVAILNALPYIGDAKCLQIVEQFARDETEDVSIAPVVAAARDCLPRLKQRIEQLKSGGTLLRGSKRSTVESHDLLHTAVEPDTRDESELLRTDRGN